MRERNVTYHYGNELILAVFCTAKIPWSMAFLLLDLICHVLCVKILCMHPLPSTIWLLFIVCDLRRFHPLACAALLALCCFKTTSHSIVNTQAVTSPLLISMSKISRKGAYLEDKVCHDPSIRKITSTAQYTRMSGNHMSGPAHPHDSCLIQDSAPPCSAGMQTCHGRASPAGTAVQRQWMTAAGVIAC